MNNKSNMTIIDSVMGSGKSSWAIQLINSTPKENYIVVVNTLSETERYRHAITRSVFVPNNENEIKVNTLQERFRILAEANKTIITTHQMLENWDEETLSVLKGRKYTLILDETTDLVQPFADIYPKDYQMLIDQSVIREETLSDGLVRISLGSTVYLESDGEKSLKFAKHAQFVFQVKTGNVYKIRNSFFLWLGQPEQLRVFDHVYILTYLFKGSVMSAWLDFHGDGYEMMSLVDGRIVSYQEQGGKTFKHLIKLVDDKSLNKIGKSRQLSSSWYGRATLEQRLDVKKSLESFFRNSRVTADESMWSVFRKQVRDIAPANFTTTQKGLRMTDALLDAPLEDRAKSLCYVPVNIKASNHYRHKKAVAVMLNYYAFPSIKAFFQETGCYFDEDRWALSECIQLIWRSQIRDCKEIHLYIPSQRMRSLVIDWLNR